MPHEHWMFYVGVLLLSSFLPLIALSHHLIRLPHKREEYHRIMDILKENEIEHESSFILGDDDVSGKDYLLPLLFVTVFSFVGFFLLFADDGGLLLAGINYAVNEGGTLDYSKSSLVTMIMAFLGSYLWSAQYLFRRLVTVDLSPAAYYSVGLRMIMGSFTAVVFHHFISYLPEGTAFGVDMIPGETLKNMIPVVGFITGMVPQRAVKYMADFFKFSSTRGADMADELPLEMIEGVTSFNKYRLSEEGVDNVQHMAQASLVELIVRTPYRPRQLVDWMAQARLCLSVKSDVVKLRKAGIRCILGLISAGDNGRFEAIASAEGLDLVQLQTVYDIFKDDKAIERLAIAGNCLHVV